MLQVCFGIYLVIALPAILLLWTALAASRMHDEVEEGYDRQRFYQIALAISNFKNALRREYDLIKDYASI